MTGMWRTSGQRKISISLQILKHPTMPEVAVCQLEFYECFALRAFFGQV